MVNVTAYEGFKAQNLLDFKLSTQTDVLKSDLISDVVYFFLSREMFKTCANLLLLCLIVDEYVIDLTNYFSLQKQYDIAQFSLDFTV